MQVIYDHFHTFFFSSLLFYIYIRIYQLQVAYSNADTEWSYSGAIHNIKYKIKLQSLRNWQWSCTVLLLLFLFILLIFLWILFLRSTLPCVVFRFFFSIPNCEENLILGKYIMIKIFCHRLSASTYGAPKKTWG